MVNLPGISQNSTGYRTPGTIENKPSSDLSGTSASMQGGTDAMAPTGNIPAVSGTWRNEAQKNGGKENKNFDSYSCETCKNRKYKDVSDDPGVSFQTPTTISPDKAASSVRAHEAEHVSREQAAAAREDRQVVSQSVSYQSAVCPECGSVYVSGGTTRTVTKGQIEKTYGLAKEVGKGESLDMTA